MFTLSYGLWELYVTSLKFWPRIVPNTLWQSLRIMTGTLKCFIEVVWNASQELWKQNPHFKNDFTNTLDKSVGGWLCFLGTLTAQVHFALLGLWFVLRVELCTQSAPSCSTLTPGPGVASLVCTSSLQVGDFCSASPGLLPPGLLVVHMWSFSLAPIALAESL